MKTVYKNIIKYSLGLVLVMVLNVGLINKVHAFSSSELIDLTNSSRTKEGLAKLSNNDQLAKAALNKANDMLSFDYFAHTSPSGKTPWDFIKASGYKYTFAGENLAIGYANSAELHNAWMNSPSHRENIMSSDFREIGVAVVSGDFNGVTTTVVVQMFGTSPIVTQVESANVADNTSQNLPTQTPASQEKNFNLIKEKTGFNPKKVFKDEVVTFNIVITGVADKMEIMVGQAKIDFKEAVVAQEQGEEKTYTKKVKISTEGNQKVTLEITDKRGHIESMDLGTLTVAQKEIIKNNEVNSGAFTSDYIDKNRYNLAGIFVLMVCAYAVFYFIRQRKATRLA